MLHHHLLAEQGILVVEPQGALSREDFASLAREVDPYLEDAGTLRGLLIQSERFPGWQDFGALVAHLRFVRDHHRRVRRIAAVTDSTFLSAAPRIAEHFVSAEVRHFPFEQREAALAWLLGDAGVPGGAMPPSQGD